MTSSHVCRMTLWLLALTAVVLLPGPSAGQKGAKTLPPSVAAETGQHTAATDPGGVVCKIYALSDLGGDANHGAWIAQTIPQVIAPGTWSQQGGKHVLSYNPAGRVLVVSHTASAQAQVATFLDDLKKAMQGGNSHGMPVGKTSALMPASHSEPAALKTADPSPIPGNYAVPVPKQQPKHLFHFIIRYEGEGIIDSNVVEFMKLQAGSDRAAAEASKGYSSGLSGFSGPTCQPICQPINGSTQSPYAPGPQSAPGNPLTPLNATQPNFGSATNSAPITPLPAPSTTLPKNVNGPTAN